MGRVYLDLYAVDILLGLGCDGRVVAEGCVYSEVPVDSRVYRALCVVYILWGLGSGFSDDEGW